MTMYVTNKYLFYINCSLYTLITLLQVMVYRCLIICLTWGSYIKSYFIDKLHKQINCAYTEPITWYPTN